MICGAHGDPPLDAMAAHSGDLPRGRSRRFRHPCGSGGRGRYVRGLRCGCPGAFLERRLQPARGELLFRRGYRPSVGGSGGYGRPSVYGGSGGYGAFSGGDRAISRRNSGQAFQQYQAPRPPPSAPPAGSSAWGGGWSAPVDRRPPVQGYLPGFGGAPNRRFGVWDGLLLGALLSSLSQPGHARFFYDNQNDPGYAQWRADADRAAQRDPAVAQKLAELDARLRGASGPAPQSRRAAAHRGPDRPAPAQESAGGGSGLVFLVLFLGAGVFVLLWLRRRRTARATPAIAGTAETRFRVGMTIPVDPAPFLLAAGKTKVRPPEGGGMVSIEAVGSCSRSGSPAAPALSAGPGRVLRSASRAGSDGPTSAATSRSLTR